MAGSGPTTTQDDRNELNRPDREPRPARELRREGDEAFAQALRVGDIAAREAVRTDGVWPPPKDKPPAAKKAAARAKPPAKAKRQKGKKS